MAESEKLVALKKNYAYIILNTEKEAPNRVMEYERQGEVQHEVRLVAGVKTIKKQQHPRDNSLRLMSWRR
ncbi:hypothetical protein OIU77_000183 [Salix suchowensis]|uniref:Uncharacterized protein n=1 Tax=Salix suchowensis TaxID=1278906 RepID=A0ABQ9B576_9ROSI|nr:hypothetical protein OIU77_000183 [Salix suchowensis]